MWLNNSEQITIASGSLPLWISRDAGNESASMAFTTILPAQNESQFPLRILLNCNEK